MIEVGFEIGNGRPVRVPADRHIAVTGQTQLSGKTTTLEALVDRSGATAVAFVTKRGEGRFQYGRQVQPYFRTPLDAGTRDVDWQFVESVLSSTLKEKMKSDSLRLAIIRATAKAKTMQQVHDNVQELLDEAKGAKQGVYQLLDAYFRKVIPELQNRDYADRLELHTGSLNVMDISDCSENVQQLVVRSVTQEIVAHRKNTRLILPEAWKFIPEQSSTPCKTAVVEFIRVGAGLGNLLWLDSQDYAGVSKIVLRAMGLWFIGAQQEYNEVLRVLKTAVVPTELEASDVKTLTIGQFYVLYDAFRFKTYIQPLWADAHSSALFAAGKGPMPKMPAAPRRSALDVANRYGPDRPGDSIVPRPCAAADDALGVPPKWREEHNDGKTDERTGRGDRNAGIPGADAGGRDRGHKAEPSAVAGRDKERNAGARPGGDAPNGAVPRNGQPAADGAPADYAAIRQRILADAEILPALAILQAQPEIKVRIQRRELPLDADTIEGMIGLLIKDGWFGQGFSRRESDVQKEAQARGIEGANHNANVGRALAQFQKWGFLIKNAERRFGLARPVRVTVEEG